MARVLVEPFEFDLSPPCDLNDFLLSLIGA
jgi:hypothetical protein